jgi:hypothetical protein
VIKKNSTLFLSVCVFTLIALGIPAVSAWTPGQSWNDNPEHIAAMQAYTAYSGELFNAKMNGAIQYIGTLNGSVSAGILEADQEQFNATVTSVQSMTTNDSISQAWDTMKTQIAQFRTDLKTALSADNGSEAALQTAVNASVTVDQANIQNLDNAYWTAREKSRLDEFSYNDARRTSELANLTAKGIDVTSAQQIETQIQALQPSLKAALDAKDDAQLDIVNDELAGLCQQFNQAVVSLSWQYRETNRLAQFDNTTTRMQDQLTNLTTKGLDVSNAQTILTQIVDLRPQLQTAFDNHDENTLKSINTQLISLDQQFNQTLRSIVSEARDQTNRTSLRDTNRTYENYELNRSHTGPGA